MDLFGLLGWIVALLIACAWAITARRRTTATEPEPPPQAAPLPSASMLCEMPERSAVLLSASGDIESIRTVRRGQPPLEYYRPHGRGSVTVYKRVGEHADRWIYQAEA